MKTLMRNGRDRRSENPSLGHAKKERVSLFGTDQRITSGPAARRPHSKAEYMTAPERFADSQIPLAPRAPSIHDPSETCAAQDFRSAKALFVPWLKRDIVHSIACTRPPAGGSHGNPHPTARIHIHTGRRSSRVAACGARAASRAHAAHRRAGTGRGRSGNAGPRRGARTRVGRIRVDRRPQRDDRLPLGRQRCRTHSHLATELVALAPQVIVANGTHAVAALLQATRTVPIVFVSLPDPVGAGFVNSLARPGGNVTGFLVV